MLTALLKQFNIESTSLHLKNGDEVFRLGAKTASIYRVITGQVKLFRDDFNGNSVILHQAFGGQFFAEASINSDQYHCTAQCVGDTELQVINIKHFRQLLNDNVTFSAAWINHLSTELRRQRASVERLSLKTAVEKITHYILTEGNAHGELTINNSLSELALIIGLSRESLYRTLTKMQNEGSIIRTKQSLSFTPK